MIARSTTLPIYMNRLHVVILEDMDIDIPIFNKKYYNDFNREDIGVGGSCRRGHHILIFISVGLLHERFDKTNLFDLELVATIAHEAVHACNQIFINKGIKPDVNNDEPQAYLTDWIVKEIYKTYLKTKR